MPDSVSRARAGILRRIAPARRPCAAPAGLAACHQLTSHQLTSHQLASLLVACLLLASLLAGCNMPGIPHPLEGDGPRPDDSPLCEPNGRRCRYGSVEICSGDGRDFHLEACPLEATCSDGHCVTISDSCDAGQPFGLSHTRLVFESNDALKSQTHLVTLTNCGGYPLFVHKAHLRSPLRGDGNPVFTFEEGPIEQQEVLPGEALTMPVRFWPDQGFSQEAGSLELGVIREGYVDMQIPISVRTYCITASPVVDFGPISLADEHVARAQVQNCGTEALTLRGFSRGDVPPSLERIEILPRIAALPFVLGPGEWIDVDLIATGAREGWFELAAMLEFDEFDKIADHETRRPAFEVRGLFHGDGCRPGAVAPLTVTPLVAGPTGELVEDAEAAQLVDRTFEAAPLQTLRLSLSDPGADAPTAGEPVVRLLERPPRSRARIERTPDGPHLTPDVVGQYRLDVRTLDASGRLSCTARTVRLDVVPRHPLYVELSWETDGDPIAEDHGLGRGADLAMHVLPAGDDPARAAWTDQRIACRSRTGGLDAACFDAGIRLLSTSHSGAAPEVFAFERAPDGPLWFGVHLLNAYRYSAAWAHLRVYRDGTLVEELSPVQEMYVTGQFWIVGRRLNRLYPYIPD